MAEHPILFNGEMVRAILDGRKTMTRRVVKNQPPSFCPYLTRCGGDFRWGWSDGSTVYFAWHPRGNGADMDSMWMTPPHGIPGDRLWVREAWRASWAHDNLPPREIPIGDAIEYLADDSISHLTGRKRHSMFMPRWASRITLEITDVRVQQLQEISNNDACAEGIDACPHRGASCGFFETGFDQCFGCAFRMLWNQVNGPRGYGWDLNPWVWAVSFKVVRA
jgi:hypothetical protein